MPHSPVVLLASNAGKARNRFSFRPAREFIEGINRSWWAPLETRGSVRMTQGAQIQQHRDAPSGLAGMDNRLAHKGISKPMGAVRRVGDDVLSKRLFRPKKILPALPVTSVNEVCGYHVISCRLEHL